MRSETKRRLDQLAWKERVRIASAIALGLVVLAALYAYAYWPDPVVETRIVSGVVTDWLKRKTKYREADVIVIWVLLDDGRNVVIAQPMPRALSGGPAEIVERRHRSGRISFLWLKPKAQ
jgi:hypothetical protein